MRHRSVMSVMLRLAVGVAMLCGGLVGAAMAAGRVLPDGGQIAYSSQGIAESDILVMDIEQGLSFNLTKSNSRNDYSPTWSPDGQEIAYVSVHVNTQQIYTMSAIGSYQTRISQDNFSDWDPAWSPDGELLAFISSRGQQGWGLFIMGANGNNPQRLATAFYSPTWSPDGNRIAVTIENESTYAIFSINRDGSNQEWLIEDLYNNGNLAWSPDGQRFAYVSDRDGDAEIYLTRSYGFNEQQLTQNVFGDSHPTWSPDGQHIAFMSTRDGNEEIYVMNADGSHMQRLTWNDVGDFSPAWRP